MRILGNPAYLLLFGTHVEPSMGPRARKAFVVRAVQAGGFGYLLKSANTDPLVQTVRSAAPGGVHLSPGAAARLMYGCPCSGTR